MRAAHSIAMVDVDASLATAWRVGARLYRLNQRFLERARKIPNIEGLPEMEEIPTEETVRSTCLLEINKAVLQGLSTTVAAAALENHVDFLESRCEAVYDYLNERSSAVLFASSQIFLNTLVRQHGNNVTSGTLKRELTRYQSATTLGAKQPILDEAWATTFQRLAHCTTAESLGRHMANETEAALKFVQVGNGLLDRMEDDDEIGKQSATSVPKIA